MVVVGGDAGDGRQKGKSRVNFERTIFFDTRVARIYNGTT
jgi:hypothetical protein